VKVTRSRWSPAGSEPVPQLRGLDAFPSGVTWFEVNKACPSCGLRIERDEGFFIGSMSLNYGVTLVCFLTPVMLLAYKGVIGTTTAIVLAGVGSSGFPWPSTARRGAGGSCSTTSSSPFTFPPTRRRALRARRRRGRRRERPTGGLAASIPLDLAGNGGIQVNFPLLGTPSRRGGRVVECA
jgi:hypothetical protein